MLHHYEEGEIFVTRGEIAKYAGYIKASILKYTQDLLMNVKKRRKIELFWGFVLEIGK